jgi:hypothetical protein
LPWPWFLLFFLALSLLVGLDGTSETEEIIFVGGFEQGHPVVWSSCEPACACTVSGCPPDPPALEAVER